MINSKLRFMVALGVRIILTELLIVGKSKPEILAILHLYENFILYSSNKFAKSSWGVEVLLWLNVI